MCDVLFDLVPKKRVSMSNSSVTCQMNYGQRLQLNGSQTDKDSVADLEKA